MEKIKDAIEKAKRDRFTNVKTGRTAFVRKTTTEKPTTDDFDSIDYAKTQQLELNQDHLERNRIVAFEKNNPASLAFDLLRTQVLQKMDENGWRTLGVISPTAEAGKTVVSINLAVSIARLTKKTALLVDLDLRRPKVGNYLGLPMKHSLNDVFESDMDISDVIVNPGTPRLVVLPTHHPIAKSSEVLSSRKTENLITELRERYESRIVVFDLPPILGIDDSIAVIPQLDCVLLVIGNGMSTEMEIEETLRLLPSTNILGFVLNKAEEDLTNYYY